MEETLSKTTIDFILSHPFIKFEEYKYTKDNHSGYDGGVLVHCTRKISGVNGIAKEGLLLKYNNSNYFTWAVNPYAMQKQANSSNNKKLSKHYNLSDSWRFGAGQIIFTVPNNVFVEVENDTEFGIYGDIPLENILGINIPMSETMNIWLSDIPSLIKDYGLETIKRVCYKDSAIPFWIEKKDYYKLFDFAIDNI